LPIIKYIKGDILEAPQRYIAHGVNCRNKMGSGVAKVLLGKWSQVKSEYHSLVKDLLPTLINGQEDLLGIIQPVDCGEKYIINMFTQENFGYDGKQYLDYDAIRSCFNALKQLDVEELAIPKIGCGLAGGDWEIVSKIIDEETDGINVYVYEL
jgi:O-acetyl-ADP-ribose deacetylase (regulator of RNase III)